MAKQHVFTELNLHGNKIINTGTAVAGTDAANKDYVDQSLTGLQTELDTTQAGAGLSATGTYVVDATGKYIATANSLANADTLIDVAMRVKLQDIWSATAPPGEPGLRWIQPD